MPSSSNHESAAHQLRRRCAATAAVLCLLLAGGCALDLEREGPPSRTYWLEPAAPDGPAGARDAAPKRNVSVTAVPGLDTDQILALQPSGQLIPLAGAHWQARIPELTESLLRRSLKPGNGTRLHVEVRRFFLERRADAAGAAVIELVAWPADDPQRTGRFIATTPVPASSLETIVAAFAQSFADVADQLGAWLG